MTRSHTSPTTIRRGRAAWLVAMAAVIALGGASGVAQGQGQGRTRALFADSGRAENRGADPTTRRGRRVRADVMALHDSFGPSAGDVTLNLFDDVQLRARRQRLDPTPRGGSVWHGRLLDVAGEATIAVNDGVMAGTVFAGDRVYEILYAGDGEHEVREIEPSAFPSDDFEGDLPLGEADPQAGELDPLVEASAAPDSASQVDVMVVWTPAATAAAGGMAAMQSLVDLAVANTNQAYANSGVTQRIRLVHAAEVSYTESSPNTDLTRLAGTSDGHLDAVHTLRNTYGADVVTLIGATYAGAGYCGLGYLMNYVSTGFATNAFNVVDRSCAAGNLTYAHEVGHNMGLHHDPANAGSSASYSYAFGYQDPGGAFRTVMSYGGAPRVRHFSNPNVSYSGRVTGTSTQNNALALNNTASTVANFRQATVGGGSCTYSLGSSSSSVGSGSATGGVSVVAGAGCSWTAASNAAWISVTSGASGSGNGTVGYSVAANTAGTSRTGTLTIAGKTFTVSQAAAACSAFGLSPTSTSVAAGGGSVSVSVSGTSGCARTASSNAAWITVTSGASGTGSGTVALSVAANTAGTSRTGTVTIAGWTFTVTQSAASCGAFTLSPTSTSVAAGGGSVSASVSGTSGCARTASSNAAWITVTSGASGTGSGTVALSVAANTAGTSRNGTATIAGQTFTVSQAAAACSFTLSPTSTSVAAGGGSVSVSVSGTSGCARAASSNAAWITVTSGASGTGSGTVALSVAANTAGTSRSGTATIAGKTFTVTQAGVACSYALSSTSASFPSGGGSGSFTVTTPSGCSSTATTASAWITITSGATGSGSRTVAYSVAPNTGGNARMGTVTLGGQTFTISQAKWTGARKPAKPDFDGDSMGDLLWRRSDGAVAYWRMNDFQSLATVFVGPGVGHEWKLAGTADLDGDDRPEILWRHELGYVYAWFLDGNALAHGAFLTPNRVDASWRLAAVADLNQDGKSDLIWQQNTGAIYVWYMNGVALASVTTMTPGNAGGDWKIMGAGDLNGDGKPDLVWQSPATGALAAWLLDGAVAATVAWLTPSHVGSDWSLRAVVDLTGDGISDLVWQHETGAVAAWQMNGVALASFHYLAPYSVGHDWTLSGPN
jgi:hypothetical protein